MMDGMAVLRMADHMLNYESANVDKHGGDSRIRASTCQWRVLPFHISCQMVQVLADSAERLRQLINEHDLQCLTYGRYGSKALKQWAYSPDAFVQMAIQLAYFRGSGGALAPTYEATQTRRHLHGRTETTRSLSLAASRWMHLMGLHSTKPTDLRREALKTATDEHSKYVAAAVNVCHACFSARSATRSFIASFYNISFLWTSG